MNIISVESWSVDLELAEPYAISTETIDHAVTVILKLETDSGHIGYGCATPDPSVTGETLENVRETIDNIVTPLLKNEDVYFFNRILERIRNRIIGCPSVSAMVEMACYDLLGKKAGLPLWKMFGAYRETIYTSVTIGVMDVEETLKRARDLVSRGFRFLKIKGGRNPEIDIERLIRVREVVGGSIGLRFDANQGFSIAEAITFANATYQTGLEFIEQPVSSLDPDQLGKVTRNVPVPVMADESLISIEDAKILASRNLADLFNIKLMKVGGYRNAFQISAIASAYEKKIMIGSNDESALSIAAGLHMALAVPEIVYADLDGHLDLKNDPAEGSVVLRSGILSPNDAPGLGLALKL